MQFLRKIVNAPSFRTLGVFAGGNALVAVLGGLSGLVQARWIAPEILGEFRKFGILPSYLNIGLVIVHDGLSRQFPYLLGKGDKERALKVAACAKWWYLMLCWVFSMFFAVLCLRSVIKGDYRSAVGWCAQIPWIWANIYGLYLGVMYRTSSEFKRLAYNNIAENIVGFCSLVLVKAWGYWGLATRTIIASVMRVYLGKRYLPVKEEAALDVKGLYALAKISLPLSIPGYIATSCLGASLSLLVVTRFGESGLGIYGMALTFQGMAMTLTLAVRQMFITRLTYKFGETGDVSVCLGWAKIPTILSISAATVCALALWFAISPFVRLVLPKYVEGVAVIRILAVQLPLSAAGLPLLIIEVALWYKSVLVLALTRFVVCLAAVFVLPKTLGAVAASLVLSELAALVVGFGIICSRKCALQSDAG